MVDNLEQIKSLLSFESEDDFYFVQIIKRKKEHPELGSNNYMVKAYYISSIESLERDYEEMKCLANFHNARVCINLNKRSYEKLAFQNLKKVADQIMNKDYKSVRKSYNSVVGQFSNDNNKKWILDIDNNDEEYDRKLQLYIHSIEPFGSKLYANIKTKNGHHLITKPFNMQNFNNQYSDIEVHKDNPTILYIP